MTAPHPVFRFAILRAARAPRLDLAIDLRPNADLTEFAGDVMRLSVGGPPGSGRHRRTGPPIPHRNGRDKATADPARLPIAAELATLDARFGELGPLDPAAAHERVHAGFGASATEVLRSPAYGRSRHALTDAIVAL